MALVFKERKHPQGFDGRFKKKNQPIWTPEKKKTYFAEYHQEHREERETFAKQYKKTHALRLALKARDTFLRKEYGISLADFEKLLEQQDGRCAICQQVFSVSRGGEGIGIPHVDHDHQTGQVRGLLCFHCNAGLGHFRESLESLETAIGYLEKSVQRWSVPVQLPHQPR